MSTDGVPTNPDTVPAAGAEKAQRQFRWQLIAVGVGLLVVVLLMIPWQVRATPLHGASGRVCRHLGTRHTTWQGVPATAWTYLVDSASIATLQRDWDDVLPLAATAAEQQGTSVVIVEARAVRYILGPMQHFEN